MELWFDETHNSVVRFGLKTAQTLFHEVSPYQVVDIIETVKFGRMLVLDNCVMTTEKDEFVYHEMITHIPLHAHPNPQRVLVIGGGDGGTVREVIKHPSVETVVLCEIDGVVIEACKTWLPSIACALDDPKVTVLVGDGIDYVAHQAQGFDLIIVDSTDPIGPGEGLFTQSFYQNAFNALNPDGMLVAQTESPFLCQSIIQKVYPMLQTLFPIVAMYTGFIPTYPSGMWSWSFCSKQHQPFLISEAALKRAQQTSQLCQYYNTDIHQAAFALPNFTRQLLKQLDLSAVGAN